MNSEDVDNLSQIKNDIEKNKLGSNSLLFSKKNVTFILKKDRIHDNPVADGQADAVMQNLTKFKNV